MKMNYLSLVLAALLLISTIHTVQSRIVSGYLTENKRGHTVSSKTFDSDSLDGMLKRNLASNYPSYGSPRGSTSTRQYQSYPTQSQQKSSPSSQSSTTNSSTARNRPSTPTPAPAPAPASKKLSEPLSYYPGDAEVQKASTTSFRESDLGIKFKIDPNNYSDCV